MLLFYLIIWYVEEINNFRETWSLKEECRFRKIEDGMVLIHLLELTTEKQETFILRVLFPYNLCVYTSMNSELKKAQFEV